MSCVSLLRERVNWRLYWFFVGSCDRVVIVLVSKTSGLVPHGFESHRLRHGMDQLCARIVEGKNPGFYRLLLLQIHYDKVPRLRARLISLYLESADSIRSRITEELPNIR